MHLQRNNHPDKYNMGSFFFFYKIILQSVKSLQINVSDLFNYDSNDLSFKYQRLHHKVANIRSEILYYFKDSKHGCGSWLPEDKKLICGMEEKMLWLVAACLPPLIGPFSSVNLQQKVWQMPQKYHKIFKYLEQKC